MSASRCRRARICRSGCCCGCGASSIRRGIGSAKLYKVQHPKYKNGELKERLWKEIGAALNKDCEYSIVYHSASRSREFHYICFLVFVDIVCTKKWTNMRDAFVKNLPKKTTGSATSEMIRPKDQSLMFLLNTSAVKRR